MLHYLRPPLGYSQPYWLRGAFFIIEGFVFFQGRDFHRLVQHQLVSQQQLVSHGVGWCMCHISVIHTGCGGMVSKLFSSVEIK